MNWKLFRTNTGEFCFDLLEFIATGIVTLLGMAIFVLFGIWLSYCIFK